MLGLWLSACGGGLPDPGSEAYQQTVSAFYTGVAAMQVGEDQRADAQLAQVTTLAPDEPAAWINLALLALRRNDQEAAAEYLFQANALAPDAAPVLLLSGLFESNRGRPDDAIAYLRQALAADSAEVRAAYALAQELDRRGDSAEAMQVLRGILNILPQNAAVLIEQARLAAALGDATLLEDAAARLIQASGGWPPEALEQLAALREALVAEDLPRATTQVAF